MEGLNMYERNNTIFLQDKRNRLDKKARASIPG